MSDERFNAEMLRDAEEMLIALGVISDVLPKVKNFSEGSFCTMICMLNEAWCEANGSDMDKTMTSMAIATGRMMQLREESSGDIDVE